MCSPIAPAATVLFVCLLVAACGSGGNATGSGGSGGGAGDGGLLFTGTGGEGSLETQTPDAGDECQRDVGFAAVTLGEPQPFDLIIVADHSDSLSWSRDELASGLRDLLSSVQGRTVRIFLLTPTQYGASSAAAQAPLSGKSVVAWSDPETGQAYENAVTSYSQTCTDPTGRSIDCPSSTGKEPYRVTGTWRFDMPDPIAVITPELSDEQFVVEQEAVAQAILDIGGSGSPEEQPLCTLGRYISQDPLALPENAVFLLISDEDDTSSPRDCLVGFQGELRVTETESGTVVCSDSCDAYRYEMEGERDWTQFELQCAAVDDFGNPIAGTEQTRYVNQSNPDGCDGFVEGPCAAEEEKRAGVHCDSGLSVISCERQCSTSPDRCRLERNDDATDLCAEPFIEAGTPYKTLADYCAKTRGGDWSDCSSSGINREVRESISGTQSPEPLVGGESPGDLIDYFRSQAMTAFGPEHYLVQGIIFEPSFSCDLGAGQSYATNIMELIGDPARAFPLCESYEPALDGVLDFAQTLIQTEFTLDVEDDEHVSAVYVLTGDGTERALSDGDYRFDPETEVLTVERSALTAGDAKLRVEVTSECRPILR